MESQPMHQSRQIYNLRIVLNENGMFRRRTYVIVTVQIDTSLKLRFGSFICRNILRCMEGLPVTVEEWTGIVLKIYQRLA